MTILKVVEIIWLRKSSVLLSAHCSWCRRLRLSLSSCSKSCWFQLPGSVVREFTSVCIAVMFVYSLLHWTSLEQPSTQKQGTSVSCVLPWDMWVLTWCSGGHKAGCCCCCCLWGLSVALLLFSRASKASSVAVMLSKAVMVCSNTALSGERNSGFLFRSFHSDYINSKLLTMQIPNVDLTIEDYRQKSGKKTLLWLL